MKKINLNLWERRVGMSKVIELTYIDGKGNIVAKLSEQRDISELRKQLEFSNDEIKLLESNTIKLEKDPKNQILFDGLIEDGSFDKEIIISGSLYETIFKSFGEKCFPIHDFYVKLYDKFKNAEEYTPHLKNDEKKTK